MIRSVSILLALGFSLTSCAKESSTPAASSEAGKAESAAKVTASRTAPAKAESMALDEILARHFDAMGGEKKLRSVTTMHYAGTKVHGDKSLQVAKYLKRGNKMRVEKRHGDEVSVMAFNGEKGWKQHGKEVKALPAEKLAGMEHEAAIDDPLLTYKDKGYETRLIGEAKVKGAMAYHISQKVGDVAQERYIDAKSFLETKRVMVWSKKDGQQYKTAIYFSDYRDVGDGMMVNHRVDWEGESGKGHFVIEQAAFNKPIDDAKFDLSAGVM